MTPESKEHWNQKVEAIEMLYDMMFDLERAREFLKNFHFPNEVSDELENLILTPCGIAKLKGGRHLHNIDEDIRPDVMASIEKIRYISCKLDGIYHMIEERIFKSIKDTAQEIRSDINQIEKDIELTFKAD